MKICDADQRTDPGQNSVLLTHAFFLRIGKLGGDARAAKMSPKKRSQLARKAAKTRWRKVSRERRLQQQEGKRE